MAILNNFKVGGFKVFGNVVELSMSEGTRNTTHLKENIILNDVNNITKKNLKTSIIYGSNNTGKSSLFAAIITMKKIFITGGANEFPFSEFTNFCYKHDGIIKFEVDFNSQNKNFIYGIELKDENSIGEYLYVNDIVMFSRSLDGLYEGEYLTTKKTFESILSNLTLNKLVIPYFLEYQKDVTDYNEFKEVKKFFDKIDFIDNGSNEYTPQKIVNFMSDKKRLNILNALIKTTELYIEERIVVSEEELLNNESYKDYAKAINFSNINRPDVDRGHFRQFIEALKTTSIYKGREGEKIKKPSILFDSIGTNKFLYLSMIIINALLEGKILLIDEFDSSLHHKLTRVLVILMNSEANNNTQFILTTHDVSLLSNILFRKDQINFIVRSANEVEIVSLDDFKANTRNDIRKTSNFDKLYLEEKIVDLPYTNIYEVIKEFSNEEKKTKI